MKKNIFKKIAAGIVSTMLAFTMLPNVLSASAANVGDKLSVGNGNPNQHKGNCDGYSYEVWLDNTGGNGSMTLGKGATFKAEWSAEVSQGNFLARRGLDFASQNKKGTDYPYIGMDYKANYSQTSKGGNSRLCVYGWFKKTSDAPLVEYYIIEDWKNWRPSAEGGSTTVTIDGLEYEIFKIMHTGPTIDGDTQTFPQYFSVCKSTRTSGHITVSDHFKAWADQGWGIGNLYEVALNAEGWESSGVADVTELDVYTDPSQAGNVEVVPPTPVEPDENGHFFYSTFEDGADDWSGRGDASADVSSSAAYAGSKSIAVTGRTDTWNGTARSLNTKAFVPGGTYAFSAMAMQNVAASDDFKLTLQCSVDGEEQYINVAEATGAKGEWVQLVNNSFTIPEGASNLLLYVETADTTNNFYIDEAIGGIEGSIKELEKTAKLGDVNGDGKIDEKDLKELQAFILGRKSSAIAEASDMNGDGKVNSFDMAVLRKTVADISTQPEQPEQPTNPNTNTDSTAFMKSIEATITNNVPGNITSGSNGVTSEEITYYSTVAGKNKKAVVILPENYSTSKKYPVVYVNHGIMGSHNDMVSYCKSIGGNLMKSGEAVEMILVSTAMYTSKTSDQCSGITAEECEKYDAFREDLIECLMPYMEKNYSIKTGRDNTAICGFSMGGRESLYIGITRPEYFGYIGAACPAPGITPAQDMFMVHPGNMQPSEFKVQNHAYDPYLLMITGGTNDSVVGTFPQEYHETLTTNGQYHIWQEIQGGGHDASCINPLMYNFLKNVFKANSSGNSNTQPEQPTQPTTTPAATGGVDISWIDPNKPMVAISFDDGASPATGTRIIDALSDSGFHATFFYVSSWINGTDGENEVKYAFSKGMEIANHTNSHPNLSEKTAGEIRNEYDTCAAKLKSIIGTDPSKLLRLPYLASNNTVTSTLNDAPLITCAIDTQDWNGASKDQIVSTVKNAMNNGSLRNSIVLCHETYENTAAAMEELCPYLKSQGWQVVTISEMFAVNGQKLNGGQIYTKCN